MFVFKISRGQREREKILNQLEVQALGSTGSADKKKIST